MAQIGQSQLKPNPFQQSIICYNIHGETIESIETAKSNSNLYKSNFLFRKFPPVQTKNIDNIISKQAETSRIGRNFLFEKKLSYYYWIFFRHIFLRKHCLSFLQIFLFTIFMMCHRLPVSPLITKCELKENIIFLLLAKPTSTAKTK